MDRQLAPTRPNKKAEPIARQCQRNAARPAAWMTNARNRAFLPHGNLRSSYHAVCASDADRSDWISKISDASCRHVLLFIAVGSELLEIAPQIRDFLVALDAGKNHLGARNLGARISDVFFEYFLVPGDAGVLVSVAVAEAFNRAGLTTIEPVKDRPDLVGGVLADAMTRRAFSE